jgi:hypothetical protein
LVASAGAGAAPDNSLACELVANSVVKKALGVNHVDRTSSATSPTAPAPYDHTVDGADQSICEIFGFDHKPSKSVLKQLSNPRKPVPAGFGRIDVTTEVRDEEPNGDGPTWKPKEALHTWIIGLHADLKALGGSVFGSPNLAADIHAAYWLGNPDRRFGYYLVGDGGPASAVVVFNFLASNGHTKGFAMITKRVVPPFTEIALNP